MHEDASPSLLSAPWNQLPKWLLYFFLGFIFWFILHFIPRENFTYVLIGVGSAFFVFGLLVRKYRLIGIREIIVVSFSLRLSLVFAPVQWSDDIYRFFWDGLKVRSFESPYQLAPINDHHKTEWDILYNKMNSISYHSPYPPVLQYIWAFCANQSGDPTWLRLIWTVVDVACVYFLYQLLILYQRPSWLVLFYAWNPLIIIEGIGQLHPEILQVFFVLYALLCMHRQWYFGVGIFIGLAICTKLWPVLALPILMTRMHRPDWIRVCSVAAGICILLYAPLLRPSDFAGMLSSFTLYYQSFEFNASLYYIIKTITNWWSPNSGGMLVSRWLGVAWMTYSAIVILRRNLSIPHAMYLVFFSLLLTSAVVHPWYLIPVLAIGLLANRYAVLLWTPWVFLSYSHYSDGAYQEQPVWIAIEYLALGIAMWAEWKLRKLENPSSSASVIVEQ